MAVFIPQEAPGHVCAPGHGTDAAIKSELTLQHLFKKKTVYKV